MFMDEMSWYECDDGTCIRMKNGKPMTPKGEEKWQIQLEKKNY